MTPPSRAREGSAGGAGPTRRRAGNVGTRVEQAREAYTEAVEALVPALIVGAVAEVADLLPRAASLEALGETNEDGLDILRIHWVRNDAGDVLYDIDSGYPDPAVEDRIDQVGSEYLDSLLDITHGEHFGQHVLEVAGDA